MLRLCTATGQLIRDDLVHRRQALFPAGNKGSLLGGRLPADQWTLDSRMGLESADPSFVGIRPIFEDLNLISIRTFQIVTNLLDGDIEVLLDV